MIAGDLVFHRYAALSRWQLARALLISAFFAIAFAFVFAFHYVSDGQPLVVGQVSPKTILAPEGTTFISQISTRDARDKAESAVRDVYDPPDAELAREQVRLAGRVFDHIDSVRHDPFATTEQKLEWVHSIPTVTLSVQTISRTLSLDEATFHRITSEALYVLDLTMRDQIRPNDVALERTRIPSRVSLALDADQADFVTQWARLFVVANSSYNAQRTNELRAQARDRVGAVYHTIEKGEAVVREGEVITPVGIESLEALGILRTRLVAEDYTGPALLSLLLMILFMIYLLRLRPALFAHSRVLFMIAVMIVLASIGVKILAIDRIILLYLFPISAVSMLLAVLVDPIVAIGSVVVLALTTGFMAHNSLEFTVYVMAGGLISALTLGRIERMPAFLWTGVYVSAANAAIVMVFRVLAHEGNPSLWAERLMAALGNGALAGLIGIGSLFVLGKLFGITTSLELIDLARPTHPLLQKLLTDAPGTYHHSLVVSQLAEHAAQRIGADPLLARVGAYYHDIGKTVAPQMFIENQLQGANVHDHLDPEQSAGIVIDHTTHGLELAEKHHLPKRLREFIPQHHGTTLAAYFHRKALQANDDASIDENRFRYPGPLPQSREAGILMLADGVEATMRAEHPSTPEAIRTIVDRIVDERLRDGQLDECELTLRDIQEIKYVFYDVLQGLYHPRVKYPELPRPAAEGGALPERIDDR